jgi:hypothetical protein
MSVTFQVEYHFELSPKLAVRGRETSRDRRTPVSLLADGTPLDIPSALQNGILRILPMKSFHNVDKDAIPTEILPSPEILTTNIPSILRAHSKIPHLAFLSKDPRKADQ